MIAAFMVKSVKSNPNKVSCYMAIWYTYSTPTIRKSIPTRKSKVSFPLPNSSLKCYTLTLNHPPGQELQDWNQLFLCSSRQCNLQPTSPHKLLQHTVDHTHTALVGCLWERRGTWKPEFSNRASCTQKQYKESHTYIIRVHKGIQEHIQ